MWRPRGEKEACLRLFLAENQRKAPTDPRHPDAYADALAKTEERNSQPGKPVAVEEPRIGPIWLAKDEIDPT